MIRKPRPVALFLLAAGGLAGAEEKPGSPEEVARRSRASVVTISSSDRRGESRGLGSGFIVRDGVVATNFHVIGQGRAFTVSLPGGQTARPIAVLAVDRARDLAVVRIDTQGVPALELGDSDALRPGQSVLAVGSPLGFRESVAQGTVAQQRELEGRQLIQVSMPIEPGSSGSPLLDLEGRVVGVIAIKSGLSLGFAVPVNDLKALLAREEPMPIARWLTVGALDPKEWQTALGGDWRQRAGRLIASGSGDGFGGRMLCLSQTPPPDEPVEVSVEVRLEDESGAAGLVFQSDGGDKHYGFYPTNGSLRLTRFEGPDVFSWTILKTVPSDRYRPGDWNHLKVRRDGPRLTCSVNGAVVIEVEDQGLPSGRAGLVKFRRPEAEFRRFRLGRELPSGEVPEDTVRQALALASRLSAGGAAPGEAGRQALEALSALGEDGIRALRERAAAQEREIRSLRSLADLLHSRAVAAKLRESLSAAEDEIDLLEAALLLARIDNPDLEPGTYRAVVERIAAEVRGALGELRSPSPGGQPSGEEKLKTLVRVLFGEWGFHGSGVEYYHRSNSYLNEVLDDREGIPITLSVVFLEVARRIGLPARGVGTPGHFLVEWKPPEGESRLIDVFNAGKVVTRAEVEVLTGRRLSEADFAPATKREIIVRMLRNLLSVAEREEDQEGMLRYLDVVLTLDPDSAPDRRARAALRFRAGRLDGAAEDLDWLADHPTPGVNPAEIEELREILRARRE